MAVLFTTLLVAASVAAALTQSTAQLRRANDRASRDIALRLAESEVHRLAAMMLTDNAWRTDRSSGSFTAWRDAYDAPRTIGGGRVRHRLTDDDGDLADDPADPVTLCVHARMTTSEAAVEVQLEPSRPPHHLLNFAITVGHDLDVHSDVTLSCERPVQVDHHVKNGTVCTPRLDCDHNMDALLRGDRGADAIRWPPTDVVALYSDLATSIPFASLPFSDGKRAIEDVVITPSFNPHGDTNADGIYLIDAGGSELIIANCRLDATLVVVDSNRIRIRGGVCWNQPSMPAPILVTDSEIEFEDIVSVLDESSRGVNFNPSQAPYRGYHSNSDTYDEFPTEFRGLLYTQHKLRIKPLLDGGSLRMTGTIVAHHDVKIEADVQVSHLDELLDDPPIGFQNLVPMRLVRGTYRRIRTPQ